MLNHVPRKRFGQNFLQNSDIIAQIIDHLNLQSTDNVVEIGPGLAALTKPLLAELDKLTVIEIDRDLHAKLLNLPNAAHLIAINADALDYDYSLLGERLRIIGNLPYNISTPLLLHLLAFNSLIADIHVMLQKEVVARLASPVGCKTYGRLSIITQYYCEVTPLFEVPATAFFPLPKVDSAVVRLKPYQQSPFEPVVVSTLQQVVAQAFSMRRKTLANNLKPLFSSHQLQQLNIDPMQRPEQISIADYVKIANNV